MFKIANKLRSRKTLKLIIALKISLIIVLVCTTSSFSFPESPIPQANIMTNFEYQAYGEPDLSAEKNTHEEHENESVTKNLSEKDIEALYRIVEAEATNEDIKGKIMVANVVFNRVNSERFPDNVFDVIHQRINGKAQFSPIDDKRYYTVKISEITIEAVDKAINGEKYLGDETLFFMARSMASETGIAWFDNNLTLVKKHGIHEFFRY